MPPSLVSPYTPRVGTQILLTDLHYAIVRALFCPASRPTSCHIYRYGTQFYPQLAENAVNVSTSRAESNRYVRCFSFLTY